MEGWGGWEAQWVADQKELCILGIKLHFPFKRALRIHRHLIGSTKWSMDFQRCCPTIHTHKKRFNFPNGLVLLICTVRGKFSFCAELVFPAKRGCFPTELQNNLGMPPFRRSYNKWQFGLRNNEPVIIFKHIHSWKLYLCMYVCLVTVPEWRYIYIHMTPASSTQIHALLLFVSFVSFRSGTYALIFIYIFFIFYISVYF
jgi:hypothetical protein